MGQPVQRRHWPSGSTFDGNDPYFTDRGPCLINCSNYNGRGLYSFHTGGVNVVMADGSVRFLKASMSTKQVAFAITSQRGDLFSE